jgi:predicted PurR-regulated permease PerM
MTTDGRQGRAWTLPSLDLAIRFGFIVVLGYWSFRVIAPFLTIGLWSAILTVATYPLFEKLARRFGPRLAAVLVTFLGLMVVIGPVTWLGFGMMTGIGSLLAKLEAGQLALPSPSDAMKDWPLFGPRLHQLWQLAANNLKVVLTEVAPLLKSLGAQLVGLSQNALFGLVELIASIVIAGFLFSRGPQLVEVLAAFLSRVLSQSGKELVALVGTTIRNIARGIIGISLLQALLGGVGFLAAGIPGAGVLAFLALLLGIVQIGPAILFLPIIVWSWTAMDTAHAAAFTVYMVLVGLVDNILKPLLISRGLSTPVPVIIVGVIGGTIAYGIVGLFFGPIVLSVAWVVIAAWLQMGEAERQTRSAAGGAQAPTHLPG